MKSLLILAASAAALSAGACTKTSSATARAALDCPERQGELTRTGVAPDRRSCTYRTAEGGEVQLQLVATNGNPRAALEVIEAQLTAAAPASATASAAPSQAGAAAGEAASAESASADAQRAAREAAADARAAAAEPEDAEDKVLVDVPGVRVEAHDRDGSDKANIDLPGLHIHADGSKDQAKIQLGNLTVDAADEVAKI